MRLGILACIFELLLFVIIGNSYALPRAPSPSILSLPPSIFSNVSAGPASQLKITSVLQDREEETVKDVVKRWWLGPWPGSSFPVASQSRGDRWQPLTDMWNSAWINRMTGSCNTDLATGYLAEDLEDIYGPLPLPPPPDYGDQPRWIWYLTILKKGARYEDFVNLIIWGVHTNYQTVDIPNIWYSWDLSMTPGIATPWLRTPFWHIKGWSKTAFLETDSDMDVYIIITHNRERGEFLTNFIKSKAFTPPKPQIGLTRASICGSVQAVAISTSDMGPEEVNGPFNADNLIQNAEQDAEDMGSTTGDSTSRRSAVAAVWPNGTGFGP